MIDEKRNDKTALCKRKKPRYICIVSTYAYAVSPFIVRVSVRMNEQEFREKATAMVLELHKYKRNMYETDEPPLGDLAPDKYISYKQPLEVVDLGKEIHFVPCYTVDEAQLCVYDYVTKSKGKTATYADPNAIQSPLRSHHDREKLKSIVSKYFKLI